jgi:allantoinase
MGSLAAAPASLAVRSSRIVTPEGERAGAVLVDDGRILAIVDAANVPKGTPTEDVGGAVLLPGLVDSHVHVNEPGRTEWEGFASATRAAAAGGVTTIVDMPLNSSPVTTTRDALERKRDAAAGGGQVDCAFWGGLVPGNASELPRLLDAGACGVKAFLCDSGIPEFPPAAESDLRRALPVLAERGKPLLVHAELAHQAKPSAGDPRRYSTWLESRPPSWESEAVALLLRLCRELRARIHVVHLSAAAAASLVAEAVREGVPLTAETCPHYLFFDAEEAPAGATEYKCAPPIRERANRERLWAALEKGTIGMIVSDHSPSPPEGKRRDTGDFGAAWGGISSLQFSLPAVWTAARERGTGVERLAEWMSANPARLAGLEASKGALAEGRDADFLLFLPDASFAVRPESIHHRHKLTPYAGRTLYGVVEAVYRGGEKIYEKGEFLGPPAGEILLSPRD